MPNRHQWDIFINFETLTARSQSHKDDNCQWFPVLRISKNQQMTLVPPSEPFANSVTKIFLGCLSRYSSIYKDLTPNNYLLNNKTHQSPRCSFFPILFLSTILPIDAPLRTWIRVQTPWMWSSSRAFLQKLCHELIYCRPLPIESLFFFISSYQCLDPPMLKYWQRRRDSHRWRIVPSTKWDRPWRLCSRQRRLDGIAFQSSLV